MLLFCAWLCCINELQEFTFLQFYCYTASQLKLSYVSQDTSRLSGSLTNYAANHRIDESLFKAILRKLDFSRVQFEKDLADFSGGQKGVDFPIAIDMPFHTNPPRFLSRR